MAVEPARSRVLIVGGVAVAVAVAASGRAADWLADPGLSLVLGLAGLVPVMVVAVMPLVWQYRATRRTRPARLSVTPSGFGVATLTPAGMSALLPIVLAGVVVGELPGLSRIDGEATPAQRWIEAAFAAMSTAVTVLLVVLAAAVAVLSWRGLGYELTPQGVLWRTPLLRRLVPWDALAPGGPQRPAPGARLLTLPVGRPDLVTQRGWAAGHGTREAPALPLQVDVDGRFLADAIRWYVDHPADRAMIGSTAEHERLVAAVAEATAADPSAVPAAAQASAPLPLSFSPLSEPSDPSGPTVPRGLRAVGILAYAAAGVGVLLAVTDLALAGRYFDGLRAAELAEFANEAAPGEEFMFGSAEIATAHAAITSVAALMLAVGSVLLVRALRRHSASARAALLAMYGAVAVGAPCALCGSFFWLGEVSEFTGSSVALTICLLALSAVLTAVAVLLLVLLLHPSLARYVRAAPTDVAPGRVAG
jgi:hypothetical protein